MRAIYSDLYTMDWTSAMATHYNEHAVSGDAIMRGMGKKSHSLQSKLLLCFLIMLCVKS